MEQLTITTQARSQMLNLTAPIQKLVRERGWNEGVLIVWCPHTTGAITVNEAALVPHKGDYHHGEGNSDAHIKSSLFGPSLPCIVSGGEVRLGTWQGLFFCEWDGPRTRQIWLQFIAA